MGFNGDLYQESGADVVMTTKGDMVDYNTERQRLGIGSTGQVLQVASSLPTWSTINLADSVLTTQGDVLYEGASALARLGQSTDNFTLATKGAGANPAWQASSTSTMSGTGDVLYSSGANTLARLAIGSTDDVLTVAGGVPTWASAGGGGSYELLGTVTQASDATDMSLSFSAITFPDTLYVNFAGKYDDSQDLGIIINGHTGTWDVNAYIWNTSTSYKRTSTGEGKGEFVSSANVDNEEAYGWFNMMINPLTQLIEGTFIGGGNIGCGTGANRCTTASQTTMTSVTLSGTTTNIRQNSVMNVYKVNA